MSIDAGEVVKEVVADAPLVFQAIKAAVELAQTWAAGDAQAKAMCEEQAQAMLDARAQTDKSHAERTAETEKVLEAAEHPVHPEPPKLQEE